MPLIRIDDPDDPRLEAYRDVRERDIVGRRGLFVAEGKVVLDMLLASPRFGVESILIQEGRLAGVAGAISAASSDPVTYIASQEVVDRIAGFHLHRGILAIGRKPPETGAGNLLAALPAPATIVAAVGIANHDNIGAIFRNAAALGAAAVLLDSTCCDPLYRKAIRVSVGAVFAVPFARAGTSAQLVDLLEAAGFGLLALSPSGRRTLRDAPRKARMALVLGTEGSGLPADLLSRMETVRIPMAKGLDSLNVATSAAIALYELAGSRD
ncbi:MAG: TrmH family RNA methyltransferase [Rhizobiaceae bacterium]